VTSTGSGPEAVREEIKL